MSEIKMVNGSTIAVNDMIEQFRKMIALPMPAPQPMYAVLGKRFPIGHTLPKLPPGIQPPAPT